MMKVFGFTTTPPGEWGAETRQVRVAVAAPSRPKAAAALRAAGLGVSNHFASHYISQSWNPTECEACLSAPGLVFWSNEFGTRKYQPAPTKES